MRFVPISIVSIDPIAEESYVLKKVGLIAGECYNSSSDTDKCMTRAINCIKRGHHSPFEHVHISLKCTVDRGVSHALVRHRHCAFQQSSTIYQKFDEIELIETDDMPDYEKQLYGRVEVTYKSLLGDGMAPSRARDVLPNNLSTNLIITTNLRQWMYMIQRRDGPGDSDKMHTWCAATRKWFLDNYPHTTTGFDLWYEKHPL